MFIAYYESHFSTMSSGGGVTFYEQRIKMSQVEGRVSEAWLGKALVVASWGELLGASNNAALIVFPTSASVSTQKAHYFWSKSLILGQPA